MSYVWLIKIHAYTHISLFYKYTFHMSYVWPIKIHTYTHTLLFYDIPFICLMYGQYRYIHIHTHYCSMMYLSYVLHMVNKDTCIYTHIIFLGGQSSSVG